MKPISQIRTEQLSQIKIDGMSEIKTIDFKVVNAPILSSKSGISISELRKLEGNCNFRKKTRVQNGCLGHPVLIWECVPRAPIQTNFGVSQVHVFFEITDAHLNGRPCILSHIWSQKVVITCFFTREPHTVCQHT